MPDQPAIGSLRFVGLGGDGVSAPFGQYSLKAMEIVGDASGGLITFTVVADPRYCFVVVFVTADIIQGTPADAFVRFNMSSSEEPAVSLNTTMVALTGPTVSVQHTWQPTPIIMPGGNNAQFIVQTGNVLADRYRVDCQMLLYDINARQRTPLGHLLWPRGGTVG